MAHQMPQLQQLKKQRKHKTIRTMVPRRFETETEQIDYESEISQAPKKT